MYHISVDSHVHYHTSQRCVKKGSSTFLIIVICIKFKAGKHGF
jgi:hypothetical protein